MNNSSQAQKGFKTFVLTLSISLIVFSVIYYYMSQTSSTVAGVGTEAAAPVEEGQSVKVEPLKIESKSVFADLSASKPNVASKAVLAGATEVPQTTTAVPATGVTSITFGLMVSFAAFLAGMIVIMQNPRKLALASFEKRVRKN